MNSLDLAILVLVALCALAGFRQGLIRTVYRLASLFISMILAYAIFPFVASFLRMTPLFSMIQNGIRGSLRLDDFVMEQVTNGPAEIIAALPLPAAFRGLLEERFEPAVHGVLQVDTIEYYVSGFFANIAINGIAIILAFMLVMVLLSVGGAMLDIVGKMPVINTFNNIGGLIVGILLGIGISWLCVIGMAFFFASSANPDVYYFMQNSFFAGGVLESMLPQLTAAP
jgi:uncharacterized membrane protein required for colicin V production